AAADTAYHACKRRNVPRLDPRLGRPGRGDSGHGERAASLALAVRKLGMTMTTPVLQMSGVDKSFGATRALSDVKLTVHPGEIHALMGENGAGKSTLMKILSGVYQPDAGEIRIDGHAVRLANPAASRAHGISLIYQELAVAPHMSVAENVFMGSEP